MTPGERGFERVDTRVALGYLPRVIVNSSMADFLCDAESRSFFG